MFLESRYLNHPYDRIWVESERLGITAAAHSTPGLWNPEWTKSGGPGRAAAAAGKRAPPPPASAGYTRRSLIFSKKGPCVEAIGRPILPDLPFDADSLSGKSASALLGGQQEAAGHVGLSFRRREAVHNGIAFGSHSERGY